MIDIIFYFGTEVIFIRVEGTNVHFANSIQPNQWATIDGLKLDYMGVIKEFPDLKNFDNWREEALRRFKEKLKSFNREEDIVEYIINDLKKYGYIPKWKMKAGFRKTAIK